MRYEEAGAAARPSNLPEKRDFGPTALKMIFSSSLGLVHLLDFPLIPRVARDPDLNSSAPAVPPASVMGTIEYVGVRSNFSEAGVCGGEATVTVSAGSGLAGQQLCSAAEASDLSLHATERSRQESRRRT